MSTIKELLDEAYAAIDAHQNRQRDPAAREFALAKTAVEDAQMRTTRGLALRQGKFKPADLEK